jgi:hypothetical protein
MQIPINPTVIAQTAISSEAKKRSPVRSLQLEEA